MDANQFLVNKKWGYTPVFCIFLRISPLLLTLFLVPHPYIEAVDLTSEAVIGVVDIFVVLKIIVNIRQKEPIIQFRVAIFSVVVSVNFVVCRF